MLRNDIDARDATAHSPLCGPAEEQPGTSTNGRVYAVPVGGIVPSTSGAIVEGLYRIFEIVVALLGLVLLLPVMLIVAAVIRWDSPGPILFFHTRPARSILKRGKELEGREDLRPVGGRYEPEALYYVPSYFTLVKFRTMYHDAQARYPELYGYRFTSSEFRTRKAKYEVDPRVTPAGRILRSLTVDELPNLWSVLCGTMRLVGPRPEAPEVLRHYTPEEMYKFAIKPGITGLAQINGRGHLNFGETIAWDLKYLRSRTVWLDIKILFKTLIDVVIRRGAF